ncbi:MFS transporter [Nonomuraea rubra]|uniref:MFS transporter n=1 Tax=Nonomuraea rubra TaxID=46180 RepID=UPI0033D98D23
MTRLRSPVAAAGLIAFALMLTLSSGNVVLPAIERDLGVSFAVSRWAVLGYALAAVAFVPLAWRFLRGMGLRRAMVWGVGGFGVASVVCALAPEIGTLLAGRLVLAAFAALLAVVTAVLAVSGEDRGTVPGTNRNAVPITVRNAVPVPVRNTVSSPGRNAVPSPGSVERDLGAELASAGSAGRGAVELGATRASGKKGGRRDGSVGGLAVAAVCATLGGFAGAAAGGGLVSPLGWRALLLLPVPLCLLALITRIPGPRPSARASATSNPATASSRAAPADTPASSPAARAPALLAVTMLATIDALVIVLSPFFLFQGQVMQSALPLVGLTVTGLPVALIAGAAIGTRLTTRLGPRAVALAGAALAALGLLLLLPLSPAWSAAEVALRLAVVGAGMGLYGGPAHSLIMTGALDRAAGRLQLARGLGYVLGPALAATLWAAEGFGRAGVGTALLPALGAAAVAALTLIPYRSMTTRRPSLQRPGAPWTPTRSRV